MCKMQSVKVRNKAPSDLCVQLVNLWLNANQTAVTQALQKLFSSQSLNHPVCNNSTLYLAPIQVIDDVAGE